jgi:hypothetical protein
MENREPRSVSYVGANGNTYSTKDDAIKYGGGLVAIRKTYDPVVEILDETVKYEPKPLANGNIDTKVEPGLSENADFKEISWPELKKLASEYNMPELNKANRAQVVEFLKNAIAK